ncbi:hypothetical protein [Streptomyces sp. S.PNR 29]|nr:hypothetical protein [Streptomyces sp. S.PNR 29]
MSLLEETGPVNAVLAMRRPAVPTSSGAQARRRPPGGTRPDDHA